jgi:hypothetical protein
MITTNFSEERRLILSARQLHLFQHQAFQLRSQVLNSSHAVHDYCDKIQLEELEDSAVYVLGYN